MAGTRIAPDNNDVVVWKFDEGAAPFVNSSTSPSAPSHAVSDLATQSGTINFQQPSPFAPFGSNSAIQFTATNSGAPRNFISGANNFEPTLPFTISSWIYLRSYNTTGAVQHLINKQDTAGVWSGVTFSSFTMQNSGIGAATYAIFLNGVTGAKINWTVPLNMWSHVGMVYDGSFTYNYLNGNLVSQWAATGAVNWGGHGPWFFGSIPSGSGSPEESSVALCDFRVANVARPLSYFQNIFTSGATSTSSGNFISTYYKLRAFDSSCATPTPVYWVSKTVDYTDAPAAPCGSLGPIEIVESWPVVGL